VPPSSTNTVTPFTYTSSDTNVATINGSQVTIVGIGSTIITASQVESTNFIASSTTGTFIVIETITTIIGNFTIPSKKHGSKPFSIIEPTSNSGATITYSSDNLSVASISGNVITINGIGTCNIVASQDIFGVYTAASSSPVTFVVTESTLVSPTELNDSSELSYFLGTSAKYGNIVNSVTISNDLESPYEKELFTTNVSGIEIIKLS
jgi:hypothetical protein